MQMLWFRSFLPVCAVVEGTFIRGVYTEAAACLNQTIYCPTTESMDSVEYTN